MGYLTRGRGEVEVLPGIENIPEQYICDDFWLEDSNTLSMPDDEFKAYWLEENAKKLLQTYPEQSFYGTFELKGEEDDDRWDLIFDGRKVTVQRYKFVPSGEPEIVVE